MNIKKIVIVLFISILLALFVACTTTTIDNKEKPNEIIGKVTSIDGDKISLDILSGDYGISDKTILSITNTTKFATNSSNKFNIGDYVTFTIQGNVIKTYPTKVRASKIISIDSKLKTPIDLRKTVSGLFEDRLPSIIIKDDKKTYTVDNGSFFVIEVDSNPSTGYSWELTKPSNLEYIGSGYLSDDTTNTLLGSGGKIYYGFIGNKTDLYVINLELYSPSGEISETRNIYVKVK